MFSVSTETSLFLNPPGAGGAFEAHVALTRRDRPFPCERDHAAFIQRRD